METSCLHSNSNLCNNLPTMDSEYACPVCKHVSRPIKGYVHHSQLRSKSRKMQHECPFKDCKRKLSTSQEFVQNWSISMIAVTDIVNV